MENKVVASHFRLKKQIGSGSFGQIYVAENTCTHRRVAAKLEKTTTKIPQLAFEAKLYSILAGGVSVPKLHWYGTEKGNNIMVIDLLGKSLEDLYMKCQRRFSLKTVLMLADQMLASVEYFHSKNFIHRDIKPDNFVMGTGSKANQVFIIDYGLAKRFRDPSTRQHIPYCDGKSLTGTARYASVGALRGVEQSRRDDLEALGYVWLYFLRGSLPWMGLQINNQKQKYARITEIKARTTFEDLCRGQPIEFVKYFNSVRALRFTDQPNYSQLRQMFRDLFIKEGYVYDYKYDWIVKSKPARPAFDNRATAAQIESLGTRPSAINRPRTKMTIPSEITDQMKKKESELNDKYATQRQKAKYVNPTFTNHKANAIHITREDLFQTKRQARRESAKARAETRPTTHRSSNFVSHKDPKTSRENSRGNHEPNAQKLAYLPRYVKNQLPSKRLYPLD